MLIPPVKLYDKGEWRQDVVDILSANSRLPLSLYGDLNGQINALELGEKRMNALLDEYTDATVADCLAELKDARGPDDAGPDLGACPRARFPPRISSTMTASSTSR
jgi:N-methylhydantoinase B/oxoprolinase/acetone carboxylase alpha subunit